jgi:uncharacterized protein (TIGR03083 family)
MDAAADPRQWFTVASAGAVEVLDAVPDDVWPGPGLGEWTVRELGAHTLRAWTTLRDYLAEPVPGPDGPVLTAAEYLATGMAVPGVHDGVARRARDDSAELGDDLVAAARTAAIEAAALVDAEPDDRRVPTRFGVLTLREYLRTRALELTVHGHDLARAVGVDVPPRLRAAAVPALGLVAELAGERDDAVRLLAAATGRARLDAGYGSLGPGSA